MPEGDLLVLGYQDVHDVLHGRETETLEVVADAYRAHHQGRTVVPHSSFLTFPDQPRDRIIALPAYHPDGWAGLKWISSFPANVDTGRPRASALLCLNETGSGRPVAVLEASTISARRTAASAALAARHLAATDVDVVGLVGCGPINLEVARFLDVVLPRGWRVLVHDPDTARAKHFAATLGEWGLSTSTTMSLDELLRTSAVVSFATNASTPHVDSLAGCRPGCVVLHLSLRDLAPLVLEDARNVVDDADHVLRARTSLHLLQQLRDRPPHIDAELGALLDGDALPEDARQDAPVTVFSPFGLGVLDVAVASYAYGVAVAEGRGARVADFLANPSDFPVSR